MYGKRKELKKLKEQLNEQTQLALSASDPAERRSAQKRAALLREQLSRMTGRKRRSSSFPEIS